MKNFYLKNYRAIHHLATIIELYFISRIFSIESINKYTVGNLPIQLGTLVLCFIVTKYSLKKYGIDDYVRSELDELNSKDL